MTLAATMRVTLGLPTRILFQGAALEVMAEAENGAFGLLPNHVDFVAALVPSVFVVVTPNRRERLFGIDEGLLVKQGHQVSVSIRRGVEGSDLASLHATVADTFGAVDEDERIARGALSRLEANIVRGFVALRKPSA